MKTKSKISNLTIIVMLIFISTLNSCGIYKYSDARKNPTNADERIKKNIEEGKSFRLSKIGKSSGGNFQFATSNPMWRAAIEKLNFAPLNNVDYAGGIIVTDWFGNGGNTNEELKITVRFLSNEIRSDGIEIIIHKKVCKVANNCKITNIESNLNNEIKFAILKKAAQIKTADLKKKKDEVGKVTLPKNF
jgi:hypothetical protein